MLSKNSKLTCMISSNERHHGNIFISCLEIVTEFFIVSVWVVSSIDSNEINFQAAVTCQIRLIPTVKHVSSRIQSKTISSNNRKRSIFFNLYLCPPPGQMAKESKGSSRVWNKLAHLTPKSESNNLTLFCSFWFCRRSCIIKSFSRFSRRAIYRFRP